MNCFDTIIFFCKSEDRASESQQYNFPAYGAFRVKSHIKIALEDFPCVVGDVNSVCHLVNKKDKMSVRAETGAAPQGHFIPWILARAQREKMKVDLI